MHVYSAGHLPQQILCGLVLFFYFAPKVNCNSSIFNNFAIVLKNNAENSASEGMWFRPTGCGDCLPPCLCFILSKLFFSWEGIRPKLKPQNNLFARTKGNECNITCKKHFVHIAVQLKVSFQSDVISEDIMQQMCYSNCLNSLLFESEAFSRHLQFGSNSHLRPCSSHTIRLITFHLFRPALVVTAAKYTCLRNFL